jgi:hypothetical protein
VRTEHRTQGIGKHKTGNRCEKGTELKIECSQGNVVTLPLLRGGLGTMCVSEYLEIAPEVPLLSHFCTVLRQGENCWKLLAHLPLELKLVSTPTSTHQGICLSSTLG